MRMEGLEAVKARIEEIRRRFPELEPPAMRPSADRGVSFGEALRTAQRGRTVTCPQELEPMIAAAAEKHGVSPALVKAVIRAESGFNPRSTSSVGALGLMQLMPGTARALGVDPLDAAQNIEGGTRYLKQQLDRFGSVDLALAAYNAGPGNVVHYGGAPPFAETRRYVDQVLGYMQDYSLD